MGITFLVPGAHPIEAARVEKIRDIDRGAPIQRIRQDMKHVAVRALGIGEVIRPRV